jgi:hypothetical protein
MSSADPSPDASPIIRFESLEQEGTLETGRKRFGSSFGNGYHIHGLIRSQPHGR